MSGLFSDYDIGFGCDKELMGSISELNDSTDTQYNQDSFKDIPIQDWGGEECVSWGVWVCRQNRLPEFSVNLGSLGYYSGMMLLQSSKEDFCYMLGDAVGKIFYKQLKEMKSKQDSERRKNIGSKYRSKHNAYSSRGSPNSTGHSSPILGSPESSGYTSPNLEFDSTGYTTSIEGSSYSTDNSSHIFGSPYSTHDSSTSQGYPYSTEGSPYCTSNATDNSSNFDSEMYSDMYTPCENLDDLEDIKSEDLLEMNSYERSLIYNNHALDFDGEIMDLERHISSYEEIEHAIIKDEEPVLRDNSHLLAQSREKVHTTSRRKEREPTNWEFLIRLLVNPQANPSLIRWFDEEKGTFRLVKPDVVTDLWNASRGNKKDISYNNFARGLRYHYTTGALERISEKQLVYGCGPKAFAFLKLLRAKQSTHN